MLYVSAFNFTKLGVWNVSYLIPESNERARCCLITYWICLWFLYAIVDEKYERKWRVTRVQGGIVTGHDALSSHDLRRVPRVPAGFNEIEWKLAIVRSKITPIHGRNYSDYTRRVGLAPRGVDSLGEREPGRGEAHSAATASITSEKRPTRNGLHNDYYNIGGLK